MCTGVILTRRNKEGRQSAMLGRCVTGMRLAQGRTELELIRKKARITRGCMKRGGAGLDARLGKRN